jgi:hypothetical protein
MVEQRMPMVGRTSEKKRKITVLHDNKFTTDNTSNRSI